MLKKGKILDHQQASEKLKAIHQSHLLHYWDQLAPAEKEHLLSQIEKIDPLVLNKQQNLLRHSSSKTTSVIQPFTNYRISGNPKAIEEGKKIISEGQLGCLILAGGQGSRLRFEGPKGLFPVTVIQQKTLFQLFAEKIQAARMLYQQNIPLAIMTSLDHLKLIHNYFIDHQYFGLEPESVSFFAQSSLPLLDAEGNLFLEEPHKIAEGPDGNGSVFQCFHASGIYKKWQDQGIRYINSVLIDNPLADPVDANLIGYHKLQKATVTAKCVLRENPQEKVGVLVEANHRVHVEEYSELPEQERLAVDATGKLKHRCANLSLFCFNLDFFSEMGRKSNDLPLHLAHKAIRYLTPSGTTTSSTPNAWKFEKFIFDVLPFAQQVNALLYPRENSFAPLKNFSGNDSISTVQEALQKQDRKIFQEITGTDVSQNTFELSQEFHYPTPKLLAKWKGNPLPPAKYIPA